MIHQESIASAEALMETLKDVESKIRGRSSVSEVREVFPRILEAKARLHELLHNLGVIRSKKYREPLVQMNTWIHTFHYYMEPPFNLPQKHHLEYAREYLSQILEYLKKKDKEG
jgi:hypothetical protein